MTNLENKIIEVKILLNEKTGAKTESKKLKSNTPDNLTPQMKTKISKTESQKKPIISVDDSAINLSKNKQDSLNLRKDMIPVKNVEDVIINPSSYLLRDGTINFSKLLIDEVLAADKLLTEEAKINYDIAGNVLI